MPYTRTTIPNLLLLQLTCTTSTVISSPITILQPLSSHHYATICKPLPITPINSVTSTAISTLTAAFTTPASVTAAATRIFC